MQDLLLYRDLAAANNKKNSGKDETTILKEVGLEDPLFSNSLIDKIKEIENCDPFKDNLFTKRTDYKVNERLINNKELEEQVNRSYDEIDLERGIQRNIFVNGDEFESIIGKPIFYELPLFYHYSLDSKTETGEIDLVYYRYNKQENEHELLLCELKACPGDITDEFEGTKETFVRAYFEISTYTTYITHLYDSKDEIFINDLKEIFRINNLDCNIVDNLKIKKAIVAPKVLFKNSKYFNKVINYDNDLYCYEIETIDGYRNKDGIRKVKDKNTFNIRIYENNSN